MMIISLYTRISTFCASILMMGLLSITAVFAQTNSTGANSIEANNNTCAAQAFYVENVKVSALADTSEEARVAATEKGLNDAWMRLLGRIVISDQPLPQLTPKALTPEDLTALLDYTRIVNETVLPSRYQAVFDYCFDRLRTRDYLASANLRHAELRSGPILILPIWETPQGPYLWRKPNPGQNHGCVSFPIMTAFLILNCRAILQQNGPSKHLPLWRVKLPHWRQPPDLSKPNASF